jgi:hypothetical protein
LKSCNMIEFSITGWVIVSRVWKVLLYFGHMYCTIHSILIGRYMTGFKASVWFKFDFRVFLYDIYGILWMKHSHFALISGLNVTSFLSVKRLGCWIGSCCSRFNISCLKTLLW